MGAGVKFCNPLTAVQSMFMPIKASYSRTITNDSKKSMKKELSAELKVKCSKKDTCKAQGDCQSGGVGLWQFVMQSNDGKSKIRTPHTVCRYGNVKGAEYNQPPACPWNACLNEDCSECASDWNEDQASNEAHSRAQNHVSNFIDFRRNLLSLN